MTNQGFSTTPSSKQLTPSDCDNDRQPKMAIQTFCSPIMPFLVVDRCRNYLANLLSRWTSSKIPDLPLGFRRYLLQFRWYFRFGWPHAISVNVAFILTVLFIVSAAVSDCRSLLESPTYTACEFAMVECRRFALECQWYMSQFRRYYYFRLVGCHLGFSTRGSVGHDCWTFRCFVHSHKPLYWFWNDMCIFKNSEYITTSGNLAVILDFRYTATSHEIGNATRKLDPKNIVVAVGILMI